MVSPSAIRKKRTEPSLRGLVGLSPGRACAIRACFRQKDTSLQVLQQGSVDQLPQLPSAAAEPAPRHVDGLLEKSLGNSTPEKPSPFLHPAGRAVFSLFSDQATSMRLRLRHNL